MEKKQIKHDHGSNEYKMECNLTFPTTNDER